MITPDNPFYAWGGLNQALFLWINAYHSHYWDALMLTMTALGDHAHYPLYMAMALLFSAWRPLMLPRCNVVIFGVGYVLTGLIVSTIKPMLDFPRPLLALGAELVHVVGRPEFFHSLPSGHATFVVLLAASLTPHSTPVLRWILWIFAALVCVSRPVLGAHFPADVVAGALIALITVMLLRGLEKYVVHKFFTVPSV
ncbi:MAG: phosphatase PAP2 family protein [Sulfuriferula sp.]